MRKDRAKNTGSRRKSAPGHDDAHRDPDAAVGQGSERKRPSFPVVAIGASAGGLEALEQLFGGMPSDTGAAFVVVTHQHPDRRSMLPELLSRVTNLSVVHAADDMELERDTVYVGADGHLGVKDHRLTYSKDGEAVQAAAIDHFFLSREKVIWNWPYLEDCLFEELE